MDPFVCIWTELLFLDITIFEVRGALRSPGDMGKPMTIKIYETTLFQFLPRVGFKQQI